MKLRAARWVGAFLVVALLGFVSGLYVDQAFSGSPYVPYFAHHSVGRVDTTELQQAIQVIQANYVDRNLDATKLAHGTVQGLVASLNDPFSTYYDPAQYKRLQDSLRSEEHTSELQSHHDLVCRLLLEKKNADATSALPPHT